MATDRKPGGRGAKRSSSNRFGHRFIEYDLTANDKEILRSEYSESDFGYGLVEDLVIQGYKYSCTHSEANSCYICTLTDRRADSHFENTSLSGKGGSISQARMALLYRHYVVAQEDWSILDQAGHKPFEDFG